VEEKTREAIKSALTEILVGVILMIFIWLFHKLFSSMSGYFHEISKRGVPDVGNRSNLPAPRTHLLGQGSLWFLHTFNTLIENMRAPTTIADTQKKTSRPFFVRLVLLHFHLGFLTHYA
jgi:hypothetical protein